MFKGLLFGFLVCGILVILVKIIELFVKEKKIRIAIEVCLVVVAGTIIIGQTILLNPPVQATMDNRYLIFKSDEKLSYKKIENIKYYDDVTMDLTPNGFRWGNSKYYSGDASINIKKDGKQLYFNNKCKAYLNQNKSFIVVETERVDGTYIFNLKTQRDTKEFYDQLKMFVD